MRFFPRRSIHTSIPTLGPLENSLLEILWNLGQSNVHEVMAHLSKPLAYTTVMTTLDRLYKKGLLDRHKSERAFIYSPAMTRAEWEQRRAGDFFSNFLAASGSRELLISCLVEAVSDRDEALLDALEQKILLRRKELEKNKKP